MKTKPLILTLFLVVVFLSGCFRHAYNPAGATQILKGKKKAFAVIGKTCYSNAQEAGVMPAALLEDARQNIKDVEHLAKKNAGGNIAGLWCIREGIVEIPGNGNYIAGVEAEKNAEAPEGWVKCLVPKQQYFAVRCEADTRNYFYFHMTENFIPQAGFELTGPAQELYPSVDFLDGVYLYFPVKKKVKQANAGKQ